MENALALYDAGIPVTIQDPMLRMYLEGHRFGYHRNAQARGFYPACDREVTNA
jgi:predicted 2-oxoglutarate/Fe(II)-dependent dioxygenase YbiX